MVQESSSCYFCHFLISSDLLLQNLEAWEEAKKEIEKIPEHPNKMPSPPPPPPPEAGEAGPSPMSKRDSTATLNGR